MLRYIFSKLKYLKLLNQSYAAGRQNQAASDDSQNHPKTLSPSLNTNLEIFKGLLGDNYDLVIRNFTLGEHGQEHDAALIYLNGMTDLTTINESILKPLLLKPPPNTNKADSTQRFIELVTATMLSVGEVGKSTSIQEIINRYLSGETILLVDGCEEALIIMTADWKARSVTEPRTESVVRGPREGFVESLLTNTTLIRRKIKSPDLVLESMKIGERTMTNICIAYIKGIANPLLIEEIKRRLKDIKTDSILESGMIEQYIEDAPLSIFSTVANTEKPDKAAAKILEGRAAILVDGTPFVLTVPMLFIESFQSSEDYYSRPYFVSIIRVFRYIAYAISILAPATYVALTTYHQELIPTALLFSMSAAQEGVPFPVLLEALGMGIIFEILREAGVRLPRPVGQAVSIVGALVVGQSAVSAGLIGAPMVIVVALTAIASFVTPAQTDSGGILRIIFTLLAGFSGGFGIMIGLIGVFIHLASLRSFGTPYLSPLAPLTVSDLKDTFIRAPLWAMITRPRTIGWRDPQREEFRLKPGPPSKEDTPPK
ncbi:spore germination protein [Desulfosporosinus youngiae]|uniref:Spore germination protein, GerA family n=1 Tax=Desulfosporosinus youngiae DSM 17734 TaxID=768710 RepID=H5Y2W6_9FIRM|nr:spore germination protein [Desulfosporosinus youngiae]EHQ88523.1 spore germination protein, GerA family [Desulfosporosinus youngiae DSM 17734]